MYNIVYASSDAYSSHTGISILSLLTNNCNIASDIKITVLDSGISDINKKKIESVCKNFGTKCDIVDVDKKLKDTCINLGLPAFRGSWSVYAQIFMEEILPQSIDKALYIDSDTVIIGSIEDLLNQGIEDFAIGAVVGLSFYTKMPADTSFDYQLAKERTYYNMGVILYNFKKWRELNLTSVIKDAAIKDPHFEIASQTMLNLYLPEKSIYRLPLQYNYWGHLYPPYCARYELAWGGYYTQVEIDNAIKKPVILHYKGPLAHPWINGSISLKRGEYIKYKKTSPWKDDPYEDIKCYLKKPSNGAFRTTKKYLSVLKNKWPFSWIQFLRLYVVYKK